MTQRHKGVSKKKTEIRMNMFRFRMIPGLLCKFTVRKRRKGNLLWK
jgi:hypothetical protein